MTIWLVWVKPEIGTRYIDTLWAVPTHAEQRRMTLVRNISMARASHTVEITEAIVEDAALKEPEQQPVQRDAPSPDCSRHEIDVEKTD